MSESNRKVRTTRRGGMMASAGMAAFLVGMLLAGGIAAALSTPAMEGSSLKRYLLSHDVEKIALVMFCWGLGDLFIKWCGFGKERRALHRDWLPEESSSTPVSQAETLLEKVLAAPRTLANTWLGTRLTAGLEFVHKRRTTEGLDDRLRYLGDLAADRSHAGYSLVRVIAWMIPILGFLGTVVGITIAVANVSPEQLDSSLTEVTGGLAMAFDATAVALTLAMMLMFAYFLTERHEHRLLYDIERRVGELLLHRFERLDAEAPLLAPIRQACEAVIAHTQALVATQIELWQRANEVSNRQTAELFAAHERSSAELAAAWRIESQRELQGWQASASALAVVEARLAENATRLAALVESGNALAPLQKSLDDNLMTLRQTQGLDEAMHSLTAAIHLMTARSRPMVSDRAA